MSQECAAEGHERRQPLSPFLSSQGWKGWIWRESPLYSFLPAGWLSYPSLCASNEGLLRPRVARARRILSRLARIACRRARFPGVWVQCLDAVMAPMPVSDLTSCARKPPRSFAAWLLRSRIENNQMPTTPIVIENSAGEAYGNHALPFG